MDELIYKLWFYNLKIRNDKKIYLLTRKINFKEFYEADISEYLSLGFDIITSQMIKDSKNIGELCMISEYLIKEEIKFILYNDEDYPEELRLIHNPPVALFVKGVIPNLTSTIAIIGSRKASSYGKNVAYEFAYELAKKQIVTVSGMARGIDTCAHRGTIDGDGETIAVLGSGFKNIYPPENITLSKEIENKGCIISEFMPDMMPFPSNFPQRNRIISALSKYVLVIEAGEKSGALITVSFALEQGKDVFAVPGSIFSPMSKGTNNLIRDGAKLITSTKDIFEEFGKDYIVQKYSALNEIQQHIINLLKGGGGTLEYLLQNAKFNTSEMLSNLSILESQSILKKLYGNYYILY